MILLPALLVPPRFATNPGATAYTGRAKELASIQRLTISNSSGAPADFILYLIEAGGGATADKVIMHATVAALSAGVYDNVKGVLIPAGFFLHVGASITTVLAYSISGIRIIDAEGT